MHPHRQRLSLKLVLAILAATVAAGGCGKPFDVKTNVRFPATSGRATTSAGGVGIEAEALTDETVLFDTFDANLILAGILPVRVSITNNTDRPIEARRIRFELASSTGAPLNPIEAGKAYNKVRSFYGISTYNIAGNKKSRSDFESYALDSSRSLSPGASRAGLIFFRLPSGGSDVSALALTVRGLGPNKSDRIELKLGST